MPAISPHTDKLSLSSSSFRAASWLLIYSQMWVFVSYRWVAVLAFGEGWHNNHHAFEYSARHGLEWWQLDMTWYVVRLLQALGLATDVKLPNEAQKQRLALNMGTTS